MWNPLSVSGSWKIDPDNRQDRGCSKVTSYRMSPEEIEALIKNSKIPAQKKSQAFSQSVSEVSKIRLEADGLEILEKIRTLVIKNRDLNVISEENKALKSRLAKIKTMLEEVLYEL